MHRERYTAAYEAIVKHHYMDDYLQSFPTVQDAIRVSTEVQDVHREANFNLRGWTSNRSEVTSALGNSDKTGNCGNDDFTFTDDSKEERILGLTWRPASDTLSFNLNFTRTAPDIVNGQRTPTKREALRTVMSLFDPLGLAVPITIQAKRIMQEVWRAGTAWDDELPESTRTQWRQWLEDLKKLKGINIPRVHPALTDAADLQLHTFVDASEAAYSAAVYWRVTDRSGHVHMSLAAAKAKVAPLKLVSIPRLELQAAVLGCRLARTVMEEYQLVPTCKYYWSDSKTVLAWLRAGPRAFKPFVAHRVAEIEEETAVNEWRWVPTYHNVADDATRNVPTDFSSTHRWFTGPPFLCTSEEEWPQEKPHDAAQTDRSEERVNTVSTSARPTLTEALPDLTRFSSWLRLIRATARVLQFVDIVKTKTDKHTVNFSRTARRAEVDPPWRRASKPRRPAVLTAPRAPAAASKHIDLSGEYVQRAEQLWVRASQQDAFATDIDALRAGRPPSTSSRLKQLAVYVHTESETVKLKSRIAAAIDITEEQREPAVLDGEHRYTQLYIEWVHKKLAHASTEVVVNEVRQQYWVLRLRPVTKQIVARCIPCRIRRAQPVTPPTGDHPYGRLGHHRRPFTFTGLDFFGPLSVTVGRRHEKRYVALFTCLTTRAIHLEVAASLSSDSAIMALRRFIARRGCPAEIYSDNGTNFRGADRELREEAALRAIRWRFICPSAPFMGGCWERLVRSVKNSLNSILRERHPHDECLSTFLAEAEYIVNSRPLTHVSVEAVDEEALTPNHFLLGGSALTAPPGAFTDSDLAARSHWRRAQRLADHFWSRWVREYLPELQYRREPHGRGKGVNLGDVVLIADGNLPRNTWPRGIVVALHPGGDGIVRVIDVSTQGGVLRRPTKKIIVLPSSDAPAPPDDYRSRSGSVRREICAGQRLKPLQN